MPIRPPYGLSLIATSYFKSCSLEKKTENMQPESIFDGQNFPVRFF